MTVPSLPVEMTICWFTITQDVLCRSNLSKISGAKKNAWWYSAKDGKLEYIGEFDSKVTSFQHDSGYLSGNDQVLIVVDLRRIMCRKLGQPCRMPYRNGISKKYAYHEKNKYY